jgi:4-amino-4-deoxy-L-arabinose transferase-like glycosyltransferase
LHPRDAAPPLRAGRPTDKPVSRAKNTLGAITTRTWCVLFVAAAGVVILWGLGQSQVPLYVRDAAEYNQYALNLIHHGVFSNEASAPFYPGVTRTPGYPAFLAFLHVIATPSGLPVQIAQFALLALIVWLVYAIALEVADVSAARISAVLTATYLPLLWFAARIGPEILATLFVTLAILLLLRARERSSPGSWVAIGLTLAAGTYVRPEIGGLGLVIALAVLVTGKGGYRSRSRLLPPAIVLSTMLLALSPWMIRNTTVAHRFVPLDSYLGADLIASADQYAGTFGYQTTQGQWVRLEAQTNAIAARVESSHPTAAEQVAANTALTRAAREIMSHQSLGKILKSLPHRLATLWGTADQYPSGRSWSTLAAAIGWLQYVALVLLVAIGVVTRRRSLVHEWPLWIAVPYFTLLHLVSHVESRYSLTARPALLVYAGIATTVLARRAVSARRKSGLGRVAPAARTS